MRQKVTYAKLKEAATAPGALGSETELGKSKQVGLEMYTDEKPGFLTVYYKNLSIGIPLNNIRSLVWETAKAIKAEGK